MTGQERKTVYMYMSACAWLYVCVRERNTGSKGSADARSSIPGPQLAMHCMALTTGPHCHQERKGLAHTFPNIPGENGISWSPRMRAKMGRPAQFLGWQGRKVPDTGQGLGDAGMDEIPTEQCDVMGTLKETG